MMVYCIKRFEFLKVLCKFPVIITIIFSKQCLRYIEQSQVVQQNTIYSKPYVYLLFMLCKCSLLIKMLKLQQPCVYIYTFFEIYLPQMLVYIQCTRFIKYKTDSCFVKVQSAFYFPFIVSMIKCIVCLYTCISLACVCACLRVWALSKRAFLRKKKMVMGEFQQSHLQKKGKKGHWEYFSTHVNSWCHCFSMLL